MAKISHFIQKAVRSDWYPILIFALSYYVWLTQPSITLVAISFMVLFLVVLVFTESSVALVPLLLTLLFSNIFGIGDTSAIPTQAANLPYSLIYGVIAIIVVLMILYFIRFFMTHKGIHKPKMKLGIGLGMILISFTLSKVRLSSQPLISFPYMDAILILLLIVLYGFFLYTNTQGNLRVFAKTIAYFGVMVSFQIISYYSSTPLDNTFTPTAGWGISNEVATILLLVLPFSLYLSIEKKRYLLLFFITIIGIVLTLSRGGILFLIFSLVLLFALLFHYQKIRFRQTLIIFLVMIGITYFFSPVLFLFIIETIVKDGFTDSGRFELYRQAWQVFLEHPWFGIGTLLSPTVFVPTPWFHSTFFDVIASLGGIGILAFLVHWIQKYLLLLTRRNMIKYFALIGILASEFYGLIDISYFHYLYFFVLILVLTFVERSELEELKQ